MAAGRRDTGRRAYLGQGTRPERLLRRLIASVFHRYDIIRPDAAGFGLALSGPFSALDGRGRLVTGARGYQPLRWPAPEETNVGTCYRSESPDAAEGHELAEHPWNLIKDLFPEKTSKTGRPRRPAREMLNGILTVLRTGSPWRDIPERYGPWQTVFHWGRRAAASIM